MKITINNEEVLCNKDFTINEEMLNTSSVILNNVYPVEWEQDKDYTSRFYYPKDYSKCKIFDEIEHPTTRQDIEGTSFSINVDTTKQYQVQTLKGQTTQSGTPTPSSPIPINITTGRQVVSVCGKNLFNKSIATTQVGYFNTTGGIESGGQSTVTTSYIPILPNTNLTISGFVVNRICYYDKNQNFLERSEVISTTPYTFNKNAYYIRIQGITNVFNLNNLQLEKGNSASSYEEYKGNDYEINLGKNLFETMSSSTSQGVTLTPNSDGSYTLNGTTTGVAIFNKTLTTQLPPGTYTISYESSVPLASDFFVRIRKANGTMLVPNGIPSQVVGNNTTTNKTTFTSTDYGTIVAINLVTTGITYNNVNVKIQLEKGSVASSFSPYKTPIYLGEIRNYKDYIFRNTTENPLYDSNLEEGQWYIHKEIGKITFTGANSENWQTWGVNFQTQGITGFYTYSFNDYNYNGRNLIISNYFANDNGAWGGGKQGINASSSGTKYGIISIENTNLSDISSSTNAINSFKTWLSSHNVELYYILNTPTNTLIEDEELINQLNSIELLEGLNNVSVSSANLPFIMNLMYNYQEGYTEEELYFCGVVENTGNISLNPRHPHYCNLQVLDFKTFLSEGETLDIVIYEKTILEAIEQIIGVIAPYGFVKGNINIYHADEMIGAYSTKDKTAYDVFNYIADITQSRWTTRMVDENTIAIDFYDPNLMPQGTAIQYNNTWFTNNKIIDMNFNYSSRDYRNKQVMLSGEVYSNVETTEIMVADGYQTQFNTTGKIGYVSNVLLNGTPASIITKEEYDLGYDGDFIYQPGNTYFESENLIPNGAIITIVYYAIIEGREVLLNQDEIEKINTMTNRKGVVARYETRNDATTTKELNQIGQSYLKYKGMPEITLKVESLENIWNIGERVEFNSPLEELSTEYMVKKKTINYITTQDNLFYTFELSSNFNSETEINYFDNQRAKTIGNIGSGEFISRNIDIENTANVIFYGLEVNEVQISGESTLQSELQTPLGVE